MVKVLLWHGYLLSGSGSNVYTLNVSAAWRRQGHDVVVMCQERNAVASRSSIARAASIPTTSTSSSGPRGTLRARVPVWFCAPTSAGCCPSTSTTTTKVSSSSGSWTSRTTSSMDTRANVTAMERAIRAFAPDVVITGHEVMGPYVARLACSATGHRYLAKLHGSALEYAVKLQERYVRYAQQGLSGAVRVVGGSRYMLEEAAATISGWSDKGTVVNPGVDVELFGPRAERTPDATVGFVGKLIVEKGVQNLIGALGLTASGGLKAVIVGYGGDEQPMSDLAGALGRGDLERARVAANGIDRAEHLRAILGRVESAYAERARSIPITFTGRLEHDPLSELLPTFDVLVAPSIVPEAFGMVAAEAAACGVLPLVPRHSGIREAAEALEGVLSVPGLLTFDPADPVEGIAAGIDRILAIDGAQRVALGIAAARFARTEWSWDRVAERLLEAAG